MSELDESGNTAQAEGVSLAAGIARWLVRCCRGSGRWLALCRQLAFPASFPGWKVYLYRWALAVAGLPLLLIVQCLNVAGLLLDECLFGAYRQVRLHRPVFILGVPRSGTTHTHHLLSADRRFTTVTLWESVFAPSITQRHLLSGLARLDNYLGGLLARLVALLERQLQQSLSSVHPTGLQSPEEDFLLLMSSLDCFLLVLFFPECDWLWRLATGDEESHRQESARVVRRYRRLLQRHVFFHGRHLQMLSKNASFAGLAQTLTDEFPDSVLIICERDADIAVRSQLRSLAQVRRWFCTDGVCPDFESMLLDTLVHYYRNLDKVKQGMPVCRRVSVPLCDLSRRPRWVVQSIYLQLGLGTSEPLHAALRNLEMRDPLRPETCVSDNQTVDARFERFLPWRHVPENRL